MSVAHDIRVGDLRVSSDPASSDAQLLSLTCVRSMGGGGSWTRVKLAASAAGPLQLGDALTISLDDGRGEGMTPVFSGELSELRVAPTSIAVTACDGLARLARLEFEAAYEEVDAAFVAGELIEAAGLTSGTLEAGPSFPRYVVHRDPRALQQLRRLAARCGVDVFTDAEGKVNFSGPATAGESHTVSYGGHVLHLALERVTASYDGVRVWGEGAASTKGAERAHWLAADLSSVSASASLDGEGGVASSEGERPRTIQDGAVQTGEAAEQVARASMEALAARPIRGALVVLGMSAVAPGDRVRVEGVPEGHVQANIDLDALELRVREVRHALDITRGFTTRMEF